MSCLLWRVLVARLEQPFKERAVVDEAGLHCPPMFVVPCPRFGGQRDDVEFLPPTFACDEFFLRSPLITGLINCSLVLGSEMAFEPFGPLATGRRRGENRDERDHRY